MFLDRHSRRVVGVTSLAIAAAATTAGATLAATHPATAAAVLAVVNSAVTCASTSPCVAGTNTSTGLGVAGTSSKGVGVMGTGSSGVWGSGSGSYGVKGTANNGIGVQGFSNSNDGLYGASKTGTGVYGTSGGSYGLLGTTSSGAGYGVVGSVSGGGIGTYGFSYTGDGLEGNTSNGNSVYAVATGSGNGVYANVSTGYGVLSYSHGSVAVYGNNSAGNGADFTGTYIGLIGRSPASGAYPLVLTDTSSNNVFYVDGVGNVSYKGGLFSYARTVNGATVSAYSAKTTVPTVEDTGTAQLVGGSAIVRLDPAFAGSIDPTTTYRVFLTPDGDTHGLFVASKTAAGFIVRETENGRSTLNFDYRIVATALGQTGRRMAVTNGSLFAQPRATMPVVPAVKAPRVPAIPANLP